MAQSGYNTAFAYRLPPHSDYFSKDAHGDPLHLLPLGNSGTYDEYSSSSSNGTPVWQSDVLTPQSDISLLHGTSDVGDWHESDGFDAHSNQWFPAVPPTSDAGAALDPRTKRRRRHSSLALSRRHGASASTFGLANVSLNEFSLYEETSKSFIISGLRQIYDNSLENGMSLWGIEDNCPLDKNSLWFKKGAARESTASLTPRSLFQRANQLDEALDPLRKRPMSPAEEAGASKTLQLAIMAFSSRWSNASGEDIKLDGTSVIDTAEMEDSSFQGGGTQSRNFELSMQRSLYVSAMEALERWSYLDSFRVILAGLLVFFIKRPPDDGEIADTFTPKSKSSSQTSDARYTTSPSDSTGARLKSDSPSSDDTSAARFTTSDSFRKLMSSHTRKDFLRVALRHLLAWSPKVRTFLRNLPKYSSARQVETDFNILFWLGVMCDTASSSLDQRHLTIPDDVVELQLSDPNVLADGLDDLKLCDDRENHATEDVVSQDEMSSKLWGSLLMPTAIPCDDPFSYQGDEMVTRAERILREGSPLKILLLRKICHLQTLMQDRGSPGEIESIISDALQVCTYWNTRFSNFFTKCLAKHEHLPWRIRTWYVMLLGHWNLGYLHVANCIETCDQDLTSRTIQSQLRQAGSLSLVLQKEGSYAIAAIARAASKDILNNPFDKTNTNVHSTQRDSAMLTDPCGDLMFLALSSACDTFLAWSQTLQLPPIPDDAQNVWLHRNVNVGELLVHYTSCIEALKIFGQQYNIASYTAKHYQQQIRSIGVGNFLDHRKFLRRKLSYKPDGIADDERTLSQHSIPKSYES